ncbi:thiolase family protein [Desulfoluna spongiiphila]|uniref:acetyl-CoA C-acyltransferase n=1 Tax=Desulfoluna spongiiphila TaxID=419481 RepID=A0A1G5E8Y3_9BACT|nr:thiolase family protein [Desulfoluna spongiiphila]SCY22968.1 3-ketoacyl-CoA thiolase [Desulfoluna spongiiphila]VVS91639.1 thiolase [Desulfoluna spongiiphila]
MREVYIVESVRTPGCKNKRGQFKETRPEDLLSFIMKACVEKTGLDPKEIDDVMCGCAFPEAEQGLNIGRVANQMAGFPESVSGATVNRFCSSGIEAIALAHLRIAAGWSEITLGAGIESMTYVPMGGNKPRPHAQFAASNPEMYISMGVTAENVAERYGITRQECDEFAVRSVTKAAKAQEEGWFTEIVPTPAYNFVLGENGTYEKKEFIVDKDDGVRAGTTVEGIARLNSPFKAGGVATAANSSQTTDGAAATLLASKEACEKFGLKPVAKLVGYAVAGCKSDEMGVGPKYAIPKVLEQTGFTLDDIDVIELNEAFATQSLHCIKELGLDESKINLNGGAIALGHPLGCTGAKLTATLLANMKRVGAKRGIVSMCIGGGMGAAGVYELV